MKIKNFPTPNLAGFLLLCSMLFVACKKETSKTNAAEEKNITEISSSSNIESSAVFDDVYNNVMGVNSECAFGQTGVFGRIITVDSSMNPGFIVRITRLNAPQQFPVKVEVDFGTGYIGKDGIARKGKMITIYTGRLIQVGKVAETSFDNFYINTMKVEGIHRIENTSTTQHLIFKVTVTNGKTTKPNSDFSDFNSINTITQIEGASTPYLASDDVLSITGEQTGSVKNDSIFLTWHSRIEQPLIKKFSCHWIVKGQTAILKSNTVAAFIDFGNGDCDNKAHVIINGFSTEITLH